MKNIITTIAILLLAACAAYAQKGKKIATLPPYGWEVCGYYAPTATTTSQACALARLGYKLPKGVTPRTADQYDIATALQIAGIADLAELTVRYRASFGCKEDASPKCDSLTQRLNAIQRYGVQQQEQIKRLQERIAADSAKIVECDSLKLAAIQEDTAQDIRISTGIEPLKVPAWEFSGTATGLSWTGANEAITAAGTVRIMRHITPDRFLVGVEAGTVAPLLVKNPQEETINIGTAFAVAELRGKNGRFEIGVGGFNRPQGGGVTTDKWALKANGATVVAPNVSVVASAMFLNSTYWEANVALPIAAYENSTGTTKFTVGPKATAKRWLPATIDGHENPALLLGGEMSLRIGSFALTGSVVTDPAGWGAGGMTTVVGQLGMSYDLTTYKTKMATAKNVKTKKAQKLIWY